jgi:dihydrodipicolinate synthase/N-acetylneuraminate lyase
LYAGIGSNCLEDSVDLAKRCLDGGVDVVVATLPSYYNLTEAQMLKYFEQLADEVDGPLMIYNIPSTTHMSIPLKVIDELSYHENIVGLKDSERSDERLQQSLSLWVQRSDFSYFIGWAARSLEALLQGADGIVPSTGNVDPSVYFFMKGLIERENIDDAKVLQQYSDEIGNLYQQGRTLGESLAALKILMQNIGFCEPWMMPPLSRLDASEEKKLRESYAELIP